MKGGEAACQCERGQSFKSRKSLPLRPFLDMNSKWVKKFPRVFLSHFKSAAGDCLIWTLSLNNRKLSRTFRQGAVPGESMRRHFLSQSLESCLSKPFLLERHILRYLFFCFLFSFWSVVLEISSKHTLAHWFQIFPEIFLGGLQQKFPENSNWLGNKFFSYIAPPKNFSPKSSFRHKSDLFLLYVSTSLDNWS